MWQLSSVEARPYPIQNSASDFRNAPVSRIPRLVIDEVVERVFGIGRSELALTTRGRAPAAEARQVAMYLAHVALGFTMRDVGRLFARDRTTVAHACGVVEDRRDDPVFDRTLELLEWTIVALARQRRAGLPMQ